VDQFQHGTKEMALVRQRRKCARCGRHIFDIGQQTRTGAKAGEGAQAHHMRSPLWGGVSDQANCVILCGSCHHWTTTGNYSYSVILGTPADYPHYNG
jgi:5-methylcytosine-specific restriction endonuclease McrA